VEQLAHLAQRQLAEAEVVEVAAAPGQRATEQGAEDARDEQVAVAEVRRAVRRRLAPPER